MRKIVFVCTGNTCRSPMAEVLFKEKLIKINKNLENNYQVISAGIFVDPNDIEISQNSRKVLKKLYNIEASHTARQLTREDLLNADLVLCMDDVQVDILKNKALDTHNIFNLRKYVGLEGNISDPYGGDEEEYMNSAKMIDEAIDLLIKKEAKK